MFGPTDATLRGPWAGRKGFDRTGDALPSGLDEGSWGVPGADEGWLEGGVGGIEMVEFAELLCEKTFFIEVLRERCVLLSAGSWAWDLDRLSFGRWKKLFSFLADVKGVPSDAVDVAEIAVDGDFSAVSFWFGTGRFSFAGALWWWGLISTGRSFKRSSVLTRRLGGVTGRESPSAALVIWTPGWTGPATILSPSSESSSGSSSMVSVVCWEMKVFEAIRGGWCFWSTSCSSFSLVADEVIEALSDMWWLSKIEESLDVRLVERSEPLRSRFFELIEIDLAGSVEAGRVRSGAGEDCVM
jgi:hypothetical protein